MIKITENPNKIRIQRVVINSLKKIGFSKEEINLNSKLLIDSFDWSILLFHIESQLEICIGSIDENFTINELIQCVYESFENEVVYHSVNKRNN